MGGGRCTSGGCGRREKGPTGGPALSVALACDAAALLAERECPCRKERPGPGRSGVREGGRGLAREKERGELGPRGKVGPAGLGGFWVWADLSLGFSSFFLLFYFYF